MKIKGIKDWLDRHDIDPVENMGGPGEDIYPFTEDELIEFISFIRDLCKEESKENPELMEGGTHDRP